MTQFSNSFKKIAAICLLLLLTVTVSGCRLLPSKTPKTTDKTETVLNVWSLYGEDVLKESLLSFAQANGVKINYTQKLPEDFKIDALSGIAADKGPDLMIIGNDSISFWQDKLVAVPEGFFRKNKKDKRGNAEIFQSVIAPAAAFDLIRNNQVYGLPLYFDALVLVYNQNIFRQKQEELPAVPTTWDEVKKASQILAVRQGNDLERGGLALGTADNIKVSADILEAMMLQNSTRMETPSSDGKTATFNLPKNTDGTQRFLGVEAVDLYTSFARPENAWYGWNNSLPDSLEAVATGKAALAIDFVANIAKIMTKYPDAPLKAAPFPQLSGVSEPFDYAGYDVLVVPRGSKNTTLAWKLAQDVYSSAAANLQSALRTIPPKQGEKVPLNQRAEGGQALKAALMSAQVWDKGFYPEKMDLIFRAAINGVIVHGNSPKAATDAAAASATDLMRRRIGF